MSERTTEKAQFRPAPWTSEGVAFLRRVMGGEVYTGLSGEALARWGVGLDSTPADRPFDRGDLARCMNVYWSAPESLRPQMREQIASWGQSLGIEVEFETRRYYRRFGNLNDYWLTSPPEQPKDGD